MYCMMAPVALCHLLLSFMYDVWFFFIRHITIFFLQGVLTEILKLAVKLPQVVARLQTFCPML